MKSIHGLYYSKIEQLTYRAYSAIASHPTVAASMLLALSGLNPSLERYLSSVIPAQGIF